MRIPVGDGWLGRVCNGRGYPIDGGPPVRGGELREIGGRPDQPRRSGRPRSDPILTGVSIVDGLATLVRGQKLPIFSVGGLPHLELAAQIAAQSTVAGRAVRRRVRGDGADERGCGDGARPARGARGDADLALFLNTADDPLVERILDAAHRADGRRAPRLRRGAPRARRDGRHDELLRGGARGRRRARRDPGPPRLPRLPLQRPRDLYERAGRHQGPRRVAHPDAGPDDARRRHHPSRSRPHRLHHRGPDRARRTSCTAAASTRRSTRCAPCRA